MEKSSQVDILRLHALMRTFREVWDTIPQEKQLPFLYEAMTLCEIYHFDQLWRECKARLEYVIEQRKKEKLMNVGGRIIAYQWYTHHARGVLAVAVAGLVNDWAAYIGVCQDELLTEEAKQDVADHGTKLHPTVAYAMFPQLDKKKYRY